MNQERKKENCHSKISKMLIQIHKGFGNKKSTGNSYSITRKQFLELSGMKTLRDDDLAKVQKYLHKKGYILTDLGCDFSVIAEKKMLGLRKVTRKLFEDLMKQNNKEKK